MCYLPTQALPSWLEHMVCKTALFTCITKAAQNMSGHPIAQCLVNHIQAHSLACIYVQVKTDAYKHQNSRMASLLATVRAHLRHALRADLLHALLATLRTDVGAQHNCNHRT